MVEEAQDDESEGLADEAAKVVLLMNQRFRVSRSTRFAWFLNRLNKPCGPNSPGEQDDSLQVLSVLPHSWRPGDPPNTHALTLVPATQVVFLSASYRFVIILDLSPSTAVVDDDAGELLLDSVFTALAQCLGGLAQPFIPPGCCNRQQPAIYITILAHSGLLSPGSMQVLVQGLRLDSTPLEPLMAGIRQELLCFEARLADALRCHHGPPTPEHDSPLCEDALEEQLSLKTSVAMVTPDVALIDAVRTATLALQLLPLNSMAGIIMITDGVTSMADVNYCDTLLTQIRINSIACSFVQVGNPYSYDQNFGHVSNVDLMCFVASATGGTYMKSCPDVSIDPLGGMNAYHWAFLSYTFQVPDSDARPHRAFHQQPFPEGLELDGRGLAWSLTGRGVSCSALSTRHKKHSERELGASLGSVVSVRLREGYLIRDINIGKGTSHLEVQLFLPWRHDIRLVYTVVQPNAETGGRRASTRVELAMEGEYERLHAITCAARRTLATFHRRTVVRTFWQTLLGVSQTDQLLVHLQSFNSNPVFYTLPESTRNGVPLFYVPPTSTTPVLSLQQNISKESSHNQFASYWKPVLSLDSSKLQRWTHVHRIGLLLEHDTPLPRYVHSPSSTGRYSVVQSRMALAAVSLLLRDWASFVLVEGSSFVKFIFAEPDRPPVAFYLARVYVKASCMLIRLAFPLDTPLDVRLAVVEDIEQRIVTLHFPQRVPPKEGTPRVRRKTSTVAPDSPNKGGGAPSEGPLQRPSDRPCTLLVTKPVEKMLICYERVPSSMQQHPLYSLDSSLGCSGTARSLSSPVSTLARYLFPMRCIWAMGQAGWTTLSGAAARTLSTLTEVRLAEGFKVAASGDGMLSLVLELPMLQQNQLGDQHVHCGTIDCLRITTNVFGSDLQDKQQKCLLQYLIFPPHSTSPRDSFSTDEEDAIGEEAEGLDSETRDLTMVLAAECWVEPQFGLVSHSVPSSISHLKGLSYEDIPKSIFPRDTKCITSLLTFEQLSFACQSEDFVGIRFKPPQLQAPSDPTYVQMTSLPFSLISLLPTSRQVELLFLTLSADSNPGSQGSSPAASNDILLDIFHQSVLGPVAERVVELKACENAALMRHLVVRPRFGTQLPFPLPPYIFSEMDLQAANESPPQVEPALSESNHEVPQVAYNAAQTEGMKKHASSEDESAAPRWRCYVKAAGPGRIFLLFMPASFSDVQSLMGHTSSLTTESNQAENNFEGDLAQSCSATSRSYSPPSSPPLVMKQDQEGEHGQNSAMMEGLTSGPRVVVSRTASLQESESNRLAFPVYLYSCTLERIRQSYISPTAMPPAQPDVIFRDAEGCTFSLVQNNQGAQLSPHVFQHPRSPSHEGSRTREPEIGPGQAQDPELSSVCLLVQELYHQSFVRAVFNSLQAGLPIASQDVLLAMDACEESLQEVDVSAFLLALCGHARPYCQAAGLAPLVDGSTSIREEDVERHSVSSPSSFPHSGSNAVQELKLEMPLSVLDDEHTCESTPGLHAIIQKMFIDIGGRYFKPVPSNPDYYFYCPESSWPEEMETEQTEVIKAGEDMDSSEMEGNREEEACLVSESDPDLVVVYRDRSDCEGTDADDAGRTWGTGRSGGREKGTGSGHRSTTDGELPEEDECEEVDDEDEEQEDDEDDGFGDGDESLSGSEGSEARSERNSAAKPPLFVHLTCSVKHRSRHGCMPVRTLPTCLGQVLKCLELPSDDRVYLRDLVVSLDIIVLTLPLEVDLAPTNISHQRYTSEGSTSLSRSPVLHGPVQPADNNLLSVESRLEDAVPGSLDKLTEEHRQAVLDTVSQVEWLLQDEMVSALRSQPITAANLQAAVRHAGCWAGRGACLAEILPLQFVFGAEQSLSPFLKAFERIALEPGYCLCKEGDLYYLCLDKSTCPSPTSQSSPRVSVCPPCIHRNSSNASSSPKGEQDTLDFHRNLQTIDRQEQEMEKGLTSVAGISVSRNSAEKLETESMKSLDGAAVKGVETICKDDIMPECKEEKLIDVEKEIIGSEKGVMESDVGMEIKKVMERHDIDEMMSIAQESKLEMEHGSAAMNLEKPERTTSDEEAPLLPDFWLVVRVQPDRLQIFTHARSPVSVNEVRGEAEPEYLRMHHAVLHLAGEACRLCNQMLLLQALHDTRVCNSLLEAESEEDIWKQDSSFLPSRNRSYTHVAESDESSQPKDYLAAALQLVPGHFSCDPVWSTLIPVHPRLKMGPSMGVSFAMQALHTVLNAFSVNNRKNMFVYQERATKSVFYLRLYEEATGRQTGDTGRGWVSASHSTMVTPQPGPARTSVTSASLSLTRSQEPTGTEEVQRGWWERQLPGGPGSPRGSETTRAVGPVDKHIRLVVHGVAQAGPEITEDLVKGLRRRLDEATLDVITVMLVRNCKLTPADVEFIQPPSSPPMESLWVGVPQVALPYLSAVIVYLRQNLLTFLHIPKYIDTDPAHHFQHYGAAGCCGRTSETDIYLYNKPGGLGTGGKGIACIALSLTGPLGELLEQPTTFPVVPINNLDILDLAQLRDLTLTTIAHTFETLPEADPAALFRFSLWSQGNVGLAQLRQRLQDAVTHSLADMATEMFILKAPLTVLTTSSQEGIPPQECLEETHKSTDLDELLFPQPDRQWARSFSVSTGEARARVLRRGLQDSRKSDAGEQASPKTTDDLLFNREEVMARRRHRTGGWLENSAIWNRRAGEPKSEQCRFEEGEKGKLHPLLQGICQDWLAYMARLGCPSVLTFNVELSARFLVDSFLTEVGPTVLALAEDTPLRLFKKTRNGDPELYWPYQPYKGPAPRPGETRDFVLVGRNAAQWHSCRMNLTDAPSPAPSPTRSQKSLQKFESLEVAVSERAMDSAASPVLVPRQRFLFISISDKQVLAHAYNWSGDMGALLTRALSRLAQWLDTRAYVTRCLLSQKMGLFHHYLLADAPQHEFSPFLTSVHTVNILFESTRPPHQKESRGNGGLHTSRGGSATGVLTPPAVSSLGSTALHLPAEALPFDELLRDAMPGPVVLPYHPDPAARHGRQQRDICATRSREMEIHLKTANLLVTWQQRSAHSNMPITVAELELMKLSARLFHYRATPLLFDPTWESGTATRTRHWSTDSSHGQAENAAGKAAALRPRADAWVQELCTAFMQQFLQFLQSHGFILIQLQPHTPSRRYSVSRTRLYTAYQAETKSRSARQKTEESGRTGGSSDQVFHLQKALPAGLVLVELEFQGCYFCVKLYVMACCGLNESNLSQGGVGQSKPIVDDCSKSESVWLPLVEECAKVRSLFHLRSFSYDFHLRALQQYLLGRQLTFPPAYPLPDFLTLLSAHHRRSPAHARNHVHQGELTLSSGATPAHELFTYIIEHAQAYGLKPFRIGGTAGPGQNYALVSLSSRTGSYKDVSGMRHHDDFDVSLIICHVDLLTDEQPQGEEHHLRLQFFLLMTSCRELFPRLSADLRRVPDLRNPQTSFLVSTDSEDSSQVEMQSSNLPSPSLITPSATVSLQLLHPLLASEVRTSRDLLVSLVSRACSHCRRDSLWNRLILGEGSPGMAAGISLPIPLGSVGSSASAVGLTTSGGVPDRGVKLTRLMFVELEELLQVVYCRRVEDLDPQLVFFKSLSPAWYQSLMKVLQSHFPHSCRLFSSPDGNAHHLAVLNPKFPDSFILVQLELLNKHAGLKMVFRERPTMRFPSSLTHQLLHLEAVINTACYHLWHGML